jgi:NAD(P)-dependent dehydrogenase (short-subunit alcohol dehydrogenase family)
MFIIFVLRSSFLLVVQVRSNSLIPRLTCDVLRITCYVLPANSQVTFCLYNAPSSSCCRIFQLRLPSSLPFFHAGPDYSPTTTTSTISTISTMSYTNTVLLTGGTSGLGYYAALNIAQKQPKYLVIITGRSDPNSSAQKINTKLSQENVAFLPLDLSSVAKVRVFAESWPSKNYPPVISLILNAGTQFLGPMETNEEGYEKAFMVNHLGHALLFHLFTPYLTSNARITITASGTHDPKFSQKNNLPDAAYTTAEELAHPNPETAHPKGMQRYNSSKLANILWTYALARHLADAKSSITVNAFNPGLMPGTGLAREYSPFARFLWFYILPRIVPVVRMVMPFVRDMEGSGADLAWVALSPETAGITGKYFDGRKEIMSSAASYKIGKQEDLWEWTVKTTVGEADGLAGLKK